MTTENPTKRLYLLTETMLEGLQQRQALETTPEYQRVIELDAQIQQVLADKRVSADEKAKQYAKLASSFLQQYRRAPELRHLNEGRRPMVSQRISRSTSPEPPQLVIDHSEAQPKAAIEPIIVEAQPKELDTPIVNEQWSDGRKDRAGKLLKAIQDNPHLLNFDQQTREVLVEGKAVKGSDINSLIAYLSSSRLAAQQPTAVVRTMVALAKMPGFNADNLGTKQLRGTVEKFQQWKLRPAQQPRVEAGDDVDDGEELTFTDAHDEAHWETLG